MSNVQSVERAIAILRCLAGAEAGVTQIAERRRPPQEHGVAPVVDAARARRGRPDRRGGYRIGPLIGELANGTGRHDDLVALARPYPRRARRRRSARTPASRCSTRRRRCISTRCSADRRGAAPGLDGRTGSAALRVVGPRAPRPRLAAADRERVLAGPLPRLTARTMVAPAKLRRRLAADRRPRQRVGLRRVRRRHQLGRRPGVRRRRRTPSPPCTCTVRRTASPATTTRQQIAARRRRRRAADERRLRDA